MEDIKLDVVALILDDDKEVLEMVRRKLNTIIDLKFSLFSNEVEFMERVLDQNIHVVVIDHYLFSGRTGLDVVRLVKAKHKENYVIGYSGLKDPKILIQYINSDIDEFVDKDDLNHLNQLAGAILNGLRQAEKRIDFLQYFEKKLRAVTN